MSDAPNKPDWTLGCIDQTDDTRYPNIGAAWNNDDGSITIRLGGLVVLPPHRKLVLRLFPAKDYAVVERPRVTRAANT